MANRQEIPQRSEEMDPIRKALIEILAIRGKTMKEASLAIGRTHSYLNEFIRKGKPKKLNEDDRRELAKFLQVDEELLKNPPRTLKVATSGAAKPTEAEARFAYALQPISRRDLPLRGRAAAGDGDIIMLGNGDVVGYVERPESLAGDLEAFAVTIVSSSMEPRYFAGEIAKIAAAKLPIVGDFVLIEMNDGAALVKRLIRQTPTEIHVEQYNPPKTFPIERANIKRVYLIVSSERR